MVGLRNNFSRYRIVIYLDGVQRRMTNSQSSFEVSGSRTSGNERTRQSYTEDVAYNCIVSYGTC